MAADDILIFYFYLSKKTRLDFSRERIHLKHQVLFSLKNNEKIFMKSSAAVVTGALRVKCVQEQPGKTEAGTLIGQSLKRTSLSFPLQRE